MNGLSSDKIHKLPLDVTKDDDVRTVVGAVIEAYSCKNNVGQDAPRAAICHPSQTRPLRRWACVLHLGVSVSCSSVRDPEGGAASDNAIRWRP